MRLKRQRDRGAALVIAMVAIIAIAGMAVALINSSSTRSQGANDRLNRFRAFQAAQAAVDRATARMADPAIGPAGAGFGIQFLPDDRIGNLTALPGGGEGGATSTAAMIEDVEYFARVGDAGNGVEQAAAGQREAVDRLQAPAGALPHYFFSVPRIARICAASGASGACSTYFSREAAAPALSRPCPGLALASRGPCARLVQALCSPRAGLAPSTSEAALTGTRA